MTGPTTTSKRTEAAEGIIRAEGLEKTYPDGTVAVEGLTLTVRRGEIFGLLGPNGAGKTTTLRMVVGLLPPTKGRTLIDGREVSPGAAVVQEQVGVCPQEITIWERLTVEENLRLIGELYEVAPAVLDNRIESLLADLKLVEKRRALASTLSGGMKRRLNLALALIHDPAIIVLDEPSPGLDPQSRLVLWDFIRKLPADGKRTVVLTTHLMEEADRLSDRVAIIDHGKLLVDDTPENLKNSLGAGDVVEILLEQGPDATVLAALAEGLRAIEGVQEVRAADTKLWVRGLNVVKRIPEIIKAIEAGGVRMEDLKVRKNTLEDVFISLTGRGLRE